MTTISTQNKFPHKIGSTYFSRNEGTQIGRETFEDSFESAPVGASEKFEVPFSGIDGIRQETFIIEKTESGYSVSNIESGHIHTVPDIKEVADNFFGRKR